VLGGDGTMEIYRPVIPEILASDPAGFSKCMTLAQPWKFPAVNNTANIAGAGSNGGAIVAYGCALGGTGTFVELTVPLPAEVP